MKEFTNNNRTFLALEVPEKVTNFNNEWINFHIDFQITEDNVTTTETIKLENTYGKHIYKILSTISSITEDQARALVLIYQSQKHGKEYYVDYTVEVDDEVSMWLFSALESLNSRLTSLGMDTTKNILLIEKLTP